MAGFENYGSPVIRTRTPAQAVFAGLGQAADQYKYDALGLALASNPYTALPTRAAGFGARALGFLAPDVAAHYIGKYYGDTAGKVADITSNLSGGIPKRVVNYAWDHLIDPNYSAVTDSFVIPAQASTKRD